MTADPFVQIGSANGAGPELPLRVSDAVNLTDGRIAVLDGGTNQLRFYSVAGELLRAEGRRGNGAGEFDVPWTLPELPGDSSQVFDLANGRISVFDDQGQSVRAVTLRPAGGHFYVGVLPDGHHLAYQREQRHRRWSGRRSSPGFLRTS